MALRPQLIKKILGNSFGEWFIGGVLGIKLQTNQASFDQHDQNVNPLLRVRVNDVSTGVERFAKVGGRGLDENGNISDLPNQLDLFARVADIDFYFHAVDGVITVDSTTTRGAGKIGFCTGASGSGSYEAKRLYYQVGSAVDDSIGHWDNGDAAHGNMFPIPHVSGGHMTTRAEGIYDNDTPPNKLYEPSSLYAWYLNDWHLIGLAGTGSIALGLQCIGLPFTFAAGSTGVVSSTTIPGTVMAPTIVRSTMVVIDAAFDTGVAGGNLLEISVDGIAPTVLMSSALGDINESDEGQHHSDDVVVITDGGKLKVTTADGLEAGSGTVYVYYGPIQP